MTVARLWLTRPIWMVRYHLASGFLRLALVMMPNRIYARELTRRIYAFRDEATASVVRQRSIPEAANLNDRRD